MSGSEAELCFWSMDLEELREAGDYIAEMEDMLQRSRMIKPGHARRTEGPVLAVMALSLAWMREVQRRYGAEPWEYPEPYGDHPAARTLDYLAARAELNPDVVLRRPGHVKDRTPSRRCDSCGEKNLLLEDWWPRLENGEFGHICRGCADAIEGRQAESARIDAQREEAEAEAERAEAQEVA